MLPVLRFSSLLLLGLLPSVALGGTIFKDDFDSIDDTPVLVPLPVEEPKPAPAPKPPAKPKAVLKAADPLTPEQRVLAEQIWAWLDAAESGPDAKVSIIPPKPKSSLPARVQPLPHGSKPGAKPAPAPAPKPVLLNARQCVKQGMARLTALVPTPSKGTLLPDALAILQARVALMEDRVDAAVELLAPYDTPDVDGATDERREVLAWLLAARTDQMLKQAGGLDEIRDKAKLANAPAGSWMGLPLDPETGAPMPQPVKSGAQASSKAKAGEVRLPLPQQVQKLLDSAEILASASTGAAQARARLTIGDLQGLLGRWHDAAGSYATVPVLAQQTQAAAAPASDYVYATEPQKPLAGHGVPANQVAEASAKQAQITRHVANAQYGGDFILYREGHYAMLVGKWPDALARFDKVATLAEAKRSASHDRAMAQALAGMEGASTKEKKEAQAKAEAAWREDAVKFGLFEGPFEAASRVYAAKCRLFLPSVKEHAAARADLAKFVAESPVGLMRGEALRVLALDAMDQGDLALAEEQWTKLDAWVAATRGRQAAEQWALTAWLPGIKEAAAPLSKPAESLFGRPNFWGKASRNPVQPGQLVCERNCAWYLDDLEADLVRNFGFVRFAQGRMPDAKALWSRLAKVDAACGGEDDLGKNPNDRTRLLFAADNKRMLAYPQEARIFDSSPLKFREQRGEFLYCTQKFQEAAQVFATLLQVDDKSRKEANRAMLTASQRHYALLVLGMARLRAGDRAGAATAWEAVAGTRTLTAQRAAYAYATTLGVCGTPEQRQRGNAYIEKLAADSGADEFVCKAKMRVALRLVKDGSPGEAEKLLASIPERAGPSYVMAQHMLRRGGHLVDPSN